MSSRETISMGECIYLHGMLINAVETPVPEICTWRASVLVGNNKDLLFLAFYIFIQRFYTTTIMDIDYFCKFFICVK